MGRVMKGALPGVAGALNLEVLLIAWAGVFA